MFLLLSTPSALLTYDPLCLLQSDVVMNTENKYVVDFDIKLAEIIAETKYMEALGFMVPELARNVALQVSISLGPRSKS